MCDTYFLQGLLDKLLVTQTVEKMVVTQTLETATFCRICMTTCLIITIMEICKAPTLRLKGLNKHSKTYIMYIDMEMLSAIKMYVGK